jgi:hypothetical protein
MVFPDSGAAKVTIRHTFSMEPFDDFGDVVFIWEQGPLDYLYYPLIFYHFTGELPGNTSGISDGARTDVFYFDRLTKLVGDEVQVFNPTPGGIFRIAFFFDSDESIKNPFLGWELDNFTVEEAVPWADAGMSTILDEPFDTDFATQDMWDFIDAGTGGEHWGILEYSFPGDDGTFLDACYELSSVYDSGINEEAVLTIDLPQSDQIMMKLRHRLYLDPGTIAFIAINDLDGDDAGEEFLVPFPCYAGGLFPYTFMRGTEFSTIIDPDGNHCVAEGWGHFSWTGENPCGFANTDDLNEEITTFFDLTPYAGQENEIRFIFRSGDEIIDPFFPFTGTDYATWWIEELTIKAL